MTTYTAVSGSTIYDVCLNTYGSLDFLSKLMIDNNFGSINNYPQNGQEFIYDETLGYAVQAYLGPVKYATRFNNSILTHDDDMIKYERNIEYQYTAVADGENIIIIPALIGALRILSIVNEIRGMMTADYSFDPNTGQISLLNGITLGAGQTLFIVYTVLITS